jgi:hypothetical protein
VIAVESIEDAIAKHHAISGAPRAAEGQTLHEIVTVNHGVCRSVVRGTHRGRK